MLPQIKFCRVRRKSSFNPFFSGLALCAIVAAIINVMSSQMLVLSSILTEDFYKKFYKKHTSDKQLVLVSRIGILMIASMAILISIKQNSSIFSLVLYAWSGLGASFGPLVIQCLLFKKLNKYSGWTAMITGSLGVILWPLISSYLPIKIEPLLPVFFISLLFSWIVAQLTEKKSLIYDKS